MRRTFDFRPGEPLLRALRLVPTSAFSLVEVTLALGIAAFCLIAIFGMIPAGLNSNKDSLRETAAASLIAAIVSDLRVTPASAAAANSPLYNISFPAAGSSATTAFFLGDDGSLAALGGPGAAPNFRAAVVINTPTNRSASTARILITWPAPANPSASGLPTNYSGSFGTVVGLDRN